MTDIARETIDEIICQLDLDEDQVRPDYSGRGMYGSTCLGFVTGTPTQVAQFTVLLALAANGHDPFTEIDPYDLIEAIGDLPPSSTDSMGYETITYWRGITVTA
ncbi:hypothetical protein SEA_LIGMA_75 [Gordonia phage Ligma]|nr:hypothetical protein SEA_LIGMA_75 [Gordonia phage Ligma]UQT02174.1 hypothetical protein SEA_AXUMITE_75 [Gordonia phage Axumite]